MLKVRPANKKDDPQILKILKEADLFYPSLVLKDFWVAEKAGRIVGTVKFEEHKHFFFLSSLAITEKERKKGAAAFLLNQLLGSAKKKVYLYTIQPEFFKKFGFKTTPPPAFLPSKYLLECEQCVPEKCVCMLRLPDAS